MDAFLILVITAVVVFVTIHYWRSLKENKNLPPGPRGVPILGNLPQLGELPHQTMYKLSQVYGPLFHLRFGARHVVVASSPAMASAFLKTHDTKFANRPKSSLAKYMFYDGTDLTGSPLGPRLRMYRKLCSQHLLSPTAVEEFKNIRQEETTTMVQGIANAAAGGSPVKIGNWMVRCTTNNLTRMLMGRRTFPGINEGETKEVKEFKDMVMEFVDLAGSFPIGDFIPALRFLDLGGLVARMKKVSQKYDSFLDRVIKEHLASGTSSNNSKHPNMLTKLLELKGQHQEDGEALTLTRIKALLMDLFIGASDSTTLTVEWLLSELIRKPHLLKKAQEEMDSVIGRDRLFQESDVHKLPYLHAVVVETLRLHPPAPLNIPHYSFEEVEVDGYRIPKNTLLFVNTWAIARNPELYDEPFAFKPERFLPGGKYSKLDVRGSDFELIPFSSGRRMCPGINLGLRMLHLTAGSLIHAFDWDLPAGQVPEKLDMDEQYGLSISRKNPLAVLPRRRLAPEAYEGIASS